MGPAWPRSATLTEAEETIVVGVRRRTLLPLDDVLGCWRETIPRLTRSALHRCLVRHGISRLPQAEDQACKRRRFAETTIGYVHIDVCELRLTEGKLVLFLAVDRVSKFVHLAFFDADTKANGAAGLRRPRQCLELCVRWSRPSLIRSTRCSPTAARPLPTCPGTAAATR